jgi:glycosyltransferase involved in cell wall biosynthesis
MPNTTGDSAYLRNTDGIRVALLGAFPPEEGRITGGVEAVTSALGDGLASRDGVEVHAVTCVSGLKRPEIRRRASGVTVHLVPLFGKAGNMTAFAVDIGRIRSALREIAPDIVHAHTRTFYGLAAQASGIPSVLTVHSIHHREVALQKGMTRVRGLVAGLYDKRVVSKAKHIIFSNHYGAECYAPWVRTADIRCIDNPIADRFFSLESSPEPDRVYFGASIIPLKNPLMLLKAASLLVNTRPNLSVRITGKLGDKEYYEECLDFIAHQGLDRNVTFLGSVPNDAMMDELSRASMLVLCSKQEVAPMIISEAMAAGKPVVTTPAGGSAEMVEDGKSGLVVPFDDHQALADGIERLLADEELRTSMGRYARAEAVKRFRCSVVVDKSLTFYNDVLRAEGKAG